MSEESRRVQIAGYLILGAERVVLVDTGLPARYADDPVGAGKEDGLDGFGHVSSMTPANLPAGQLALVGLTPDDVTDLVITHGDVDHVGGLGDFPSATLVVGRAEFEAGPPRYHASARPLAWPAQRYRLVESDEELLPGVELLATPGHSPGHLSLLVRLPVSGTVVLAGDAISRPAELESGVNGGAWDEEIARGSSAKLLRIAEQEGAQLVFGHDLAQWLQIPKAPILFP